MCEELSRRPRARISRGSVSIAVLALFLAAGLPGLTREEKPALEFEAAVKGHDGLEAPAAYLEFHLLRQDPALLAQQLYLDAVSKLDPEGYGSLRPGHVTLKRVLFRALADFEELRAASKLIGSELYGPFLESYRKQIKKLSAARCRTNYRGVGRFEKVRPGRYYLSNVYTARLAGKLIFWSVEVTVPWGDRIKLDETSAYYLAETGDR